MLNLEIKLTEQFGRGLYYKNEIHKGQWIMLCETLVLSSKDTLILDSTDLRYYTFKLDDDRDLICLGNGSIFNHSDNPNVSYETLNLNGRTMMLFKALRDIEPGEQLFIDYRADQNTGLEYNKNLI